MVAQSLEARIRTLERLLILSQGAADVEEEVLRHKVQIAELGAQRDVGNVVYGGPIRTQIATSAFSTGPWIRDLDATFDADFTLWIPDYLLRIIRCQFRLRPVAVRLPATVAAAATTPSGGAATSGSEASHAHFLPPQTSTVTGDHEHGGIGTTTSNNGGVHTHGVSFIDMSVIGNHSHVVAGFTSDAGASHSHSTPDHTHPSHTHALTLGILEGGIAANLRLFIDGVDRTAALGGPWNAAVTLDITQYLIDVRMKPVAGDHTIKIESSAVGAIELFQDWYVIARPV